MKFKFKNKDLPTLTNLIDNLHTTAMRVNRGKIKVYSAISDKLHEYAEDESDILKQYVVIDEDGQFAKKDDGSLALKDGVNAVEVNQQLEELQNEIITISSGDYTNRFVDFFEWLVDCDVELTTQENILVDNLLEQYEEQTKGE